MTKPDLFVVPGAPAELQKRINASRSTWRGWRMMAEETPEGGSSDETSEQKPDEFKSEASKQSVLSDLAKERTARQALQAEVDSLKPLKEQMAALAAAFAPAGNEGEADATSATLASVQERLDKADRAALVERVARQHSLTDDADVAILAAISDPSAMEAAAKRLQAAAAPADGRRIPKPDRGLGHSGGDEKLPGSVAAGRDLYRAAHSKN